MGSSCSTLPRLCPACKTRIWHCMPGSKCCLEVLCTSRNLVYPEEVVFIQVRVLRTGRVGSLSVTFFVSERAGWVDSVASFCPHVLCVDPM